MLNDAFEVTAAPAESRLPDADKFLSALMHDVRILLAAPRELTDYAGLRTPFNQFDLQHGPCAHLQAFIAYRLQDAGYQVSPYRIQAIPESKFGHVALCADVGGIKLFDPSLPQFYMGQRARHDDYGREIVLDNRTSPIAKLSQIIGSTFYMDIVHNGYAELDEAKANAYLSAFTTNSALVMSKSQCLQFMAGNTTFRPDELVHCRDEVNLWLDALWLRPCAKGWTKNGRTKNASILLGRLSRQRMWDCRAATRLLLCLALIPHFKGGDEGALRDFDIAVLAHLFLALFLFVQQFALP